MGKRPKVTRTTLAAASLFATIAGAIACSSSSAPGTTGSGSGSDAGRGTLDASSAPGDGSSTNTNEDGGTTTSANLGDDADDAAPVGPHASVRIGNFAQPGFQLDFCLSTTSIDAGAQWVGPMLASTETYAPYERFTRYADAPVNASAIRFVLRDSTACDQVVDGMPDFDIPPVPVNGRATVLFLGAGFDAGGPPLQAVEMVDEAVPDDGGSSVRIVNLLPNVPSFNVYAYTNKMKSTSSCQLLFSNVQFGHFGTAESVVGDGGPTDPNGYTPLRGENLNTLVSNDIGYVAPSQDCSMPIRVNGYEADVSHGAWSLYVEADQTIFCRDDGSDLSALCYLN